MTDILILGATGLTGQRIIQYLASHPQRTSFSLAIGVRSQSQDASLRKSLGLDESVQVLQLDVADYAQVEAAVRNAKVVINAVAPYWLSGTNVVRACTVHGKRYVDCNSEPYYVRRIIDDFDYFATKTGAVIVPSCGLHSLPADITVYLANRTLKSVYGPQTQLGLSQSFYRGSATPSDGSLATIVNMIEAMPRNRIEESFRDYALSQVRGAPSPPKQLVAPVPFSSGAQYGTTWAMAYTHRSVVQRSFGVSQYMLDNARVLFGGKAEKEKQEAFRPLAYGRTFSYAEYFVPGSGSYLSTALYSAVFAAVFGLLLFAPIRWIAKFFLPKQGGISSDDELHNGSLELTNYTAAASFPGRVAKTTMWGKGGASYILTAYMVSECALGLLLDDASLPASARPGGVLTPATALGDVIVRRLEGTGKVRFESEVVSVDKESRKER
ncbi:Saccharopine dehydrogenase-domain-containing protein [Lenzites betulinus]|nr:Saccharopine dehydrogenase-domain-containing protein [Lenzites betulinus]